MVYFILEESPWKSLQDSSSRYRKSYSLFPQGPVALVALADVVQSLFTVFVMGHIYENAQIIQNLGTLLHTTVLVVRFFVQRPFSKSFKAGFAPDPWIWLP